MPDEHKLKMEKKKKDLSKVHSPPHYKKTEVETIDLIKNSMEPKHFQGYLQGNVMKYVCRYRYKGFAMQDLKKAQWYLDRLVMEIERDE